MDALNRIAELDRRFGIPGIAKVVKGNGELSKVIITSSEAAGEIYLHGAHVTSWKPAGGEEVLFVSAMSRWENGRAIRGGVPICFPWFVNKADDPNAPAHGFVRIKAWELESIVKSGGAVVVSMFTESDAITKKWWPADFRLVYRATFGSKLELELLLTNTGTTSLRFQEALHTYFEVGDIRKARLRGLDTVAYIDKTDQHKQKTQHGELVIAAETDSVYLNTRQSVELEDPVLHRRIRVVKENSLSTVVWNPWIQKAQATSDLGDDEWTEMVCIECSNVMDHAADLAPGKQHSMKAITTVIDF